MKFYVNGFESTVSMMVVEADSEEEAIEKAWNGEIVEGTQDTEPGSNIWKKKWVAEEVNEVVEGGPWGGRTLYMPK